jgi:hypothetical protein
MGTLVKGGCEGVRMMPANMNRKLFDKLNTAGAMLAVTGHVNMALLSSLAKPERYPPYLAPVFKVLTKTPLLSFYWDNQLKENGVYEERFAQPFVTD